MVPLALTRNPLPWLFSVSIRTSADREASATFTQGVGATCASRGGDSVCAMTTVAANRRRRESAMVVARLRWVSIPRTPVLYRCRQPPLSWRAAGWAYATLGSDQDLIRRA